MDQLAATKQRLVQAVQAEQNRMRQFNSIVDGTTAEEQAACTALETEHAEVRPASTQESLSWHPVSHGCLHKEVVIELAEVQLAPCRHAVPGLPAQLRLLMCSQLSHSPGLLPMQSCLHDKLQR